MNNPVLTAIRGFHGFFVFDRRTEKLAQAIVGLLPLNVSILDIGCGDGTIDQKIMELRPDVKIAGLEITPRPQSKIPVTGFDGHKIPFPDRSFDICLFVDVLHHTTNYEELLEQAKRVCRQSIVIKDHYCENGLDKALLVVMDWVGNRPYGVDLVFNYKSRQSWQKIWKNLDLEVVTKITSLGLYPFPWSLLFDRGLHFVQLLKKI